MKTFAVLAAALCVLAHGADKKPDYIPSTHELLYEQDFDRPDALNDFVMTDQSVWRISEEEKGGALELLQQSKYKPEVRSPVNIALIKGKTFGDFILEADFIQTGREYGHRDMCLFFGFQNPKQFYYAHIATKADDHAHNVFIVNNEPRTKLMDETTSGVDWGLNIWHKIRLERRVNEGTIKVYFDDMTLPIMIAEDKNFGDGSVGFGSFDDTGRIDNLRIWGPSLGKAKPVIVFPKPN